MGKKKNPAAVALGKLAASRRTRQELAEAGRQGGLAKAANRANGTADERTMRPEVADTPEFKHEKTLGELPDTELAKSVNSKPRKKA